MNRLKQQLLMFVETERLSRQ